MRRQTIASFIVNRPISNLCKRGLRKRGSIPHHFWWEKILDLDEARASATDGNNVASDNEEEEVMDP